ncbi:MAG TPA: alanine--tRNA ligase-related protein [Candidatus Nanoarchaeia archaeon]|nr:alanine--tRNA ligase-related protein [Candidatus Nanoarchaeia archaeon]
MTKKLFWEDPYQTECTAKVTSIDNNKVKLDQTIFYAFSGGQLSDEGTIGGIKVLEAKKEGDKEDIIDIEYTLEQEPSFNVGDTVQVKIDAER